MKIKHMKNQFVEKMLKNQFWASLTAFLSDFEHGVYFFEIFRFSIFFELKP